jgi:hypothetical protein
MRASEECPKARTAFHTIDEQKINNIYYRITKINLTSGIFVVHLQTINENIKEMYNSKIK